MEKIVNKQKAPKDILLNKILKDVDKENGVVVEVQKEKIKKKPMKKRSWLKRFFYFSLLLLIICIILVIYFINHAIKDEDLKTKIQTPSIKKQIYVPKKKVVTPMIVIENAPTILKKPIKPKSNIEERVTQKVEEAIEMVIPLSPQEQEALARRKAKAKLLNEMKN